SLNEAGFLDSDRYRELKAKREAAFALEPLREAAFAGSAYPEDPIRLADLLMGRIGKPQGAGATVAIAAPHAGPNGGWATYRAAYQSLPSPEEGRDRTFVVLGTSHYGAPDRFGLTRKQFATPLGEARTDVGLVDELAANADGAVRMEDYCHCVEHSIEFQIIFLQHIYGPAVRIIPILCGPFVKSIYEGGLPENNEGVARFFDTLGNIAARESKRLFWVLGIDMSHIGRRYGDPIRAKANIGEMVAIEQRDRDRIAQINTGDIQSYWSLVQDGQFDRGHAVRSRPFRRYSPLHESDLHSAGRYATYRSQAPKRGAYFPARRCCRGYRRIARLPGYFPAGRLRKCSSQTARKGWGECERQVRICVGGR